MGGNKVIQKYKNIATAPDNSEHNFKFCNN